MRGVFRLIFKPDSAIVNSYVILILAGYYEFDRIPNLFNLREAVANALGLDFTE